jgi:hypothetical protein
MCAVITVRTPASMAAANGARSRSRSTSSPSSTRSSATCESVRVAPWPGTCFAQAAIPWLCTPRTNAAPWRPASSVVAPKDRTPITGLAGSELTSTTGASIVAAHDRAVRVLPAQHAVNGQLAMLVVMLIYTTGGLLLLFSS